MGTKNTKVGIVYATASKIIRRLIVPDNDSELNDPAHVQAGETMLIADFNTVPHPLAAPAALMSHLGVASLPSGRCAAVNPSTSIVEQVLLADPAIDKHPIYTLVLNDTATAGWKHSQVNGADVFLPPYAVVSKTTGKVTAIEYMAPTSAVSPPAGQLYVPNTGYNLSVGDAVPGVVPTPATGVTTI